MPAVVLLLLFCALPLGAAANEILTAVALGAALLLGDRRQLSLLAPVLLVGVTLLVSSAGHGWESSVEALGRTWPLALLVAVPMLADPAEPRLRAVELAGLWMAAAVGFVAAFQAFQEGVPPWVSPQSGPFSHHLTLGYALVPAFARALHRKEFGPALGTAVGIVCSGGSGPLLSLGVAATAWLVGGGSALAIGTCVALAAFVFLGMDGQLHERSLLWTAGADLAVDHPLGVGPGRYREMVGPVQAELEEGFHFANHAHDSALQIAARTGFVSWIAWGWLFVELWRRTDRAGRASIAALAVGSLTQDVFGDLEVMRALSAWALLPFIEEPEPTLAVEPPAEAPPAPAEAGGAA